VSLGMEWQWVAAGVGAVEMELYVMIEHVELAGRSALGWCGLVMPVVVVGHCDSFPKFLTDF
jgi:hypothetical protein